MSGLRERIKESFGPAMRFGLQDAELLDEPGAQRIEEWITAITDAVVAEVSPELDALKTAIATVRADCKAMAADKPPAETDHQIWLNGVRAQATRVLNILTALGISESNEGES